MKTLFKLLLVLGVGAFLLYRFVLTTPEKRSCQKLIELCGEDTIAIDRCVGDVKELGHSSKTAVDKFDTCMADAKSCVEGTGCLVGVGLNAAGHVVNDFLKGVGKALQK